MLPLLFTSRGRPDAWTVISTPPPRNGRQPRLDPPQTHVWRPPAISFSPMIHASQLAPTPMSVPPPGRPIQPVPWGGRTGLDPLPGVEVDVDAVVSSIAEVKMAGRPL